jgi:hypothetical protein
LLAGGRIGVGVTEHRTPRYAEALSAVGAAITSLGAVAPMHVDPPDHRHAAPAPLIDIAPMGCAGATGIHGEHLYSPRTATTIASGVIRFLGRAYDPPMDGGDGALRSGAL